MGSLLIDRILDMEVEYVKMFADVIEHEAALTFIDTALPDMYSHNFSLYKSKQGLFEFIVSEINKEDTKARGFLRIETHYPISAEMIDNLPMKPQICKYDLMHIETKKFRELKGNPDFYIVNAENRKILEDGIEVDILANQKAMGLDFAKRRIFRKSLEYQKHDKAIQLFVCYCGETPIGKIEFMSLNGIAKLEDFDILENFQRKGYGTSVLKFLLEKSFHNDIEHAYLITDSSDSAKEMYKKCGFEKIGEKTELLFLLNRGEI